MTADFEDAYSRLRDEWQTVAGYGAEEASAQVWDQAFAQMRQEQSRLVRDGLWVSGYSDLMHIGRVADGELTHSNVVAWLLEPAGRHGLGDRLLRALLTVGWPDLPVPDTEGALVAREVRLGNRIADIVVYIGATTLVIENKVWAQESVAQCEDLYRIWTESEHGSDVRFLLLTIDGHPPRETATEAAAESWRRLAYPALGGWLQANLPASVVSVAQRSVEQYVATIRQTCGAISPFEIPIGGGRVRG